MSDYRQYMCDICDNLLNIVPDEENQTKQQFKRCMTCMHTQPL